MKVRFSTIEEFLAELQLDAPIHDTSVGGVWDEHILRVTRQYHPTPHVPLEHLFVLATCGIRGKVVELRQPCGQVMRIPHGESHALNEPVEARADALLDDLRRAALALGLEVRAGVYEP
jgi:hypothetical protein